MTSADAVNIAVVVVCALMAVWIVRNWSGRRRKPTEPQTRLSPSMPADIAMAIHLAAKEDDPATSSAAVLWLWKRLYDHDPDLTRSLGELAEEAKLALLAQYGDGTK